MSHACRRNCSALKPLTTPIGFPVGVVSYSTSVAWGVGDASIRPIEWGDELIAVCKRSSATLLDSQLSSKCFGFLRAPTIVFATIEWNTEFPSVVSKGLWHPFHG